MFKIIRRTIFYGGIGFVIGLYAGHEIWKPNSRDIKPVVSSPLEKVVRTNIIINPKDNKKYKINFDTSRLEPYQTGQTGVAPSVHQEEKKDLIKLFE